MCLRPRVPNDVRDEVGVCERVQWTMQRAISPVPRSKFAEREREKRISGTANGSRRFESCHLDQNKEKSIRSSPCFRLVDGLCLRPRVPNDVRDEVGVCERVLWTIQRAISPVPRSKFAEREREKRISGTANGSRRITLARLTYLSLLHILNIPPRCDILSLKECL